MLLDRLKKKQLHAAFIDFKQAYDTVPRAKLWEHFRCIGLPAHILFIIQNLYARDEYDLVDGLKRARVAPARGVKQGCPLSPLLFSLYINDISSATDECAGAVAGACFKLQGQFHAVCGRSLPLE